MNAIASVNHDGIWTPTTTGEILANTPLCSVCHGDGVTSPGTPCKTCHGSGHIMSDRLHSLFSKLCEKEYYDELDRQEEEQMSSSYPDDEV